MTNHQDRRRLNSALYVPCSLVQIALVVVVRVIVDVLGVMIVVLIGRHKLLYNSRSHFCRDFL